MKKAMMAFAAFVMSCVLANSAARAADDNTAPTKVDSVIQDQVADGETTVNNDLPANSPLAGMTQQALGGMMQLGDILMGDIPSPRSAAMQRAKVAQSCEDQVALGGAADAAPAMDGQMGMGKVESAGSAPVVAMGGCPMLRFRPHCPFALEGPNALTDDQCQKLYDIKGQFIATIVPKGLNTYVLIRKMGDLLTASNTDMKAVRDTERQISAATTDLSISVMDSLINVDQVLTPAQREELHQQLIRAAIGAGRHRHHEEPHPDK